MVWVTGPFAITAGVLLVGGVLKLRDTRPARAALAELGVPAPGAVARLSGPIEIVVAALALLKGGWLSAIPVAVAYLLFVAIVTVQLHHDDTGSCGCFGRLSARPAGVHLVTNAGLALMAVIAVAADPPGLATLVETADPLLDGVVLVGLVVLATALVVAVLTVLPATNEAARPVTEPAVPLFEIGTTR
jgi:hypothetical protein